MVQDLCSPPVLHSLEAGGESVLHQQRAPEDRLQLLALPDSRAGVELKHHVPHLVSVEALTPVLVPLGPLLRYLQLFPYCRKCLPKGFPHCTDVLCRGLPLRS